MFHAKVVTVTDARTQIVDVNSRRQALLVKNPDLTDNVKVGGDAVTFATGFSVLAGDTLVLGTSQFSREAKGALYGIADTGQSVQIEVLEFNVEGL